MLLLRLLATILVSAAAFTLLLIILLNDSRKLTNRIFAILCGLCTAYPIVNFLSNHDPARALFWSRSTFTLVAGMLGCLVLFAGNFPSRILSRFTSSWILLVTVVIAGLSQLPLFIPGVQFYPGRTDVVTGPIYGVFAAFVVLSLAGTLVLMEWSKRHSAQLDRERVRYMEIGFFLTAACLAVTNLVLPSLVGNDALSEVGSYFFVIFIGVTAAAIVRQRFMDVRLVVARSVAYILLLASLAFMYAAAIFAATRLFFAGQGASIGLQLIDMILAIIMAFTFQPLRRFFEKVTDRVFYRDRYDSQRVLDELSRLLVSEISLDRILKHSLGVICSNLRLEFGQVMVLREGRVYRVEHLGELPDRIMVAPQLTELGRELVVADNLESGKRKEIMNRHSIQVATALLAHREVVGYILLGQKLSGDNYSSQDIELIQIAGKELAVAVSNARAYEEIQTFNATLQEKVAHATNRLRVANRRLKQLDRAKDEFISMASHQLRTPLTTIKGYLSMILEGDTGKISPTQAEYLGYAFESSERMVNLISDLLNVSRLSAGRFLIEKRPTDVVAMVADEVRQLQSHASAKGIALKFVPPAKPLPEVLLDDNKTRQVMMNFIDNAIYYTAEGSVTVKLALVKDRFRFEVSDTGIGVPEAAKKHLFTKFYRAENAQATRPDGTGLGLYLAKRVVEDQDGTIIFSSTEGHGSTFGFEMPLAATNEEKHG